MRAFKFGLISILIIFLLLTAIGSLMPSEVVVTRSIHINKPADSIAPYIDNYDNWNQWMQGAKTNDIKVISKDNITAYFGTMVIKRTDKKNYTWMHEWKSRTLTQQSVFTLVPVHQSSDVEWKFQQHVKWYPWEKLGSIMNDKIIGQSLEQKS